MEENEIWLPVVGYEGLYEVSNLGRVRSLVSGRVMRPQKNRVGYLRVPLYKNGKGKMHSVHRLVATAYIPNPLGLPIINHKNEQKDDNRAENLEWCDNRYNCTYGTRAVKNAAMSHEVFQFTMSGAFVAWYPSVHEAARLTGLNSGGIVQCVSGKSKTFGNYQWRYNCILFLDATEGTFNNARSKRVYQYDTRTGRFVREWPSVAEVRRQTGWVCIHISHCCRGKQNSAYGFRWFYSFQGLHIPINDRQISTQCDAPKLFD